MWYFFLANILQIKLLTFFQESKMLLYYIKLLEPEGHVLCAMFRYE